MNDENGIGYCIWFSTKPSRSVNCGSILVVWVFLCCSYYHQRQKMVQGQDGWVEGECNQAAAPIAL